MATKKQQEVLILGRDAILAADDLKKELVAVPEWGGHVYVQEMTGKCRDSFEAQLLATGEVDEETGKTKVSEKNFANTRALFCSVVVTDADGNLLFTKEDIEALGEKSGAALQRIYEVGSRLNNFTAEEERAVRKK